MEPNQAALTIFSQAVKLTRFRLSSESIAQPWILAVRGLWLAAYLKKKHTSFKATTNCLTELQTPCYYTLSQCLHYEFLCDLVCFYQTARFAANTPSNGLSLRLLLLKYSDFHLKNLVFIFFCYPQVWRRICRPFLPSEAPAGWCMTVWNVTITERTVLRTARGW